MIASILAAEGPNGNWIPGDPNEFYWGSAAFVTIAVVFLWKGLPAIRSVMQAHSARIEEELDAAAAMKAEAEAEVAALSGQIGDAGTEAAEILDAASEQATKLEADLIAKAESDVAESRERARIEIAGQRDQALADLRAAVAAQVETAADAVVRDNLDAGTQTALIDDYIGRLAG